MLTTQPTSVDRPDIIREDSRKALSFKEVKDCLIKFLMISEVPFSSAERLPVTVNYKYKELGQKDDSIVALNNHVSYKATLRLQGITVDKQPIYVIAVPFELESLSHSERNKIIAIKQTFKVIIFDERDWIKLKLDVSDKSWLKPLTRGTLKSWARILFKKISELEGTVQSDFTLNSLLDSIETKVTAKGKPVTKSKNLNDLKTRLLTKELEIEGYSNLSVEQEEVLSQLVSLDVQSIKWFEETVNSVLTHCIAKVNTSQSVYKELFRQKNGSVKLLDSEKFAQLIYDYISANKSSLEVEVCGPGLVQIRDKKTFQLVTLLLKPTASSKGVGQLTIGTAKLKKAKSGLGLLIEMKPSGKSLESKAPKKIGEVSISLFSLTGAKSKKLKKSDRLDTLSSLKDGLYLWSDIL